MSALFEESVFLVIDSLENENHSLSTIQKIITRNGGRYILLAPESSLDAIQNNTISHIITSNYDFSGFQKARDLMLPITSPQWLQDSELTSQRKNYRLYSPQPLPFMDKVVVCIADNLPEGDKDMMYAGVRAFGGQYLDSLSRYTTHLIANDLSNNKSVLAANIKQRENLKIQIVLPHWLDDSFKAQKLVDERPYRLSDPVTLRTGNPNFEIRGTVADSIFDDEVSASLSHSTFNRDLLKGKRVFLASDHSLSEHFRDSLCELIEFCGGIVVTDFELANIDVFVGKYREGSEYRQCVNATHVEVASLRWLYQVIVRKEYVSPLDSNLLNFPLPRAQIPELIGKRVSVTGYSGDARHYLSLLITAMGALFTKTLDAHNSYLVAEKHRGEKYMAVKSRWPEVKIVNHVWIEHCFAQWKFLDPSNTIYQNVDEETPRLGTTVVDKSLIELSVNRKDSLQTVDDSFGEKSDAKSDGRSDGFEIIEEGARAVQATETSKATSPEPTVIASSPLKKSGVQTSDASIVDNGSSQPEEPIEQTFSRSSRSAKQKASSRLHSDMEDLNKYTSILKSTRKMNSYMRDLESSIDKAKKKPANAGSPIESRKRDSSPSSMSKQSPSLKKQKGTEIVEQVAIMTGCEVELTLNRADVVMLGRMGIKVVNDYSSLREVHLLVAPRVLRTEKFLKCLSQCTRVIHPSYFAELLSYMKSHPDHSLSECLASTPIDDYLLDAVIPVKQINEDLGVHTKESGLTHLLNASNKGCVFKGLKLNVSHNLNGGPDLITSILKEHGVDEIKKVKLSNHFKKKDLIANPDKRRILIAHKDKDKRLVKSLCSEDVTIVEWDWCVKSIFKLRLDEFRDYVIQAS